MHRGCSRGRLWRSQTWMFVVGLALVTSAVVAAEYAPSPSWARLWDNVHWTLAYVAGAAVAYLGQREAEGPTRRARTWFTASLVAMTVGQLMWDAFVYVGYNPFPGPAELPFLCVGIFIFVGLATYLGGLRGAERWACALDSVGITLAVLTLTLALYLPRRGDFSAFAAVVLVAYPVILLGASGTALVVMVAYRARPTFSSAHFVASVLSLGVCWIVWNWRTLEGTLEDAAFINYAYSYAALSFGLAAARFEIPAHKAPELERPYYLLSSSVPLVLVLVAAIALVFGQELGPVTYVAIRVCVVLVVLIAVARQSLLLRERDEVLRAERTVRETEERFRQMAENIDEVFVITEGPEHRPVYVGPAFERIWGRPTAELVGGTLTWRECIHEEDRVRFDQALAQTTPSVVVAYRIVHANGSTRWVRDRRTRIGHGDTLRVAGIVEDVTEQHRQRAHNAELQILLAKSERLKSLGTLAGGIAHDFNNILAAVLGNAELIARGLPKTGRDRVAIDGILMASERARDLVKGMLAFARHEEASVVPVPLENLVREVLALLRPVVPSSTQMVIEVEDGLPEVLIDPAQFHQVVVNLVTNATHAIGARPGRITMCVGARTVREGEVASLAAGRYVAFSIRDDGDGMDEPTRARIFDPFFTTKPPGEGTGLGLSVVHGIISNHRGAIDVTSAPGEGTSFEIILPAVPAAPRVVKERPPSVRPHPPELAREVLVVDDDEMVLETLSLVLESLGVRTVSRKAPTDALALFALDPSRFAVVITDMTMPGMKGDAFAERIRTLSPSVPLVLVSGNDVETPSGLFTEILPKPYTRAALAETIMRCIDVS